MTDIVVAIIFGGASSEHRESIRAAQILYREAIQGKLDNKYIFQYFYLTRSNKWATAIDSWKIIRKEQEKETYCSVDRILDLYNVDMIYNTMMGTCGENGNIMGLADIIGIPVIGCGILASALTLDKQLSKILAKNVNIPIVPYFSVDKDDGISSILEKIEEKIQFPCFVKPINMGTCSFVFRAENASDFVEKWTDTIRRNTLSDKYLIEKFIPNVEVRVFIYEDINDKLHTNDDYITILKKNALERGGVLFDHLNNDLPLTVRNKICYSAIKIFKLFGMKDYSRIDFFIDTHTYKIYFNEANTQPFIGFSNIEHMKKDGISYAYFLDTMIRRNLRRS